MLHRIFYPYKKLDSLSGIMGLSPFMFTLERFVSFPPKLIKNVPEQLQPLSMPSKIVEPIIRKSVDQTIPSNPNLLEKPAIIFTDRVVNIRKPKPESNVELPVQPKIEVIPPKMMAMAPKQAPIHLRSYIPDKPDTLFWAMYIAKHGMEKYIKIGKKYGNVEIDRKQKMMEYLQEHKKSLKSLNHKITNIAIQEMIAAILANRKTTLSCLAAFTVYYKKNIIVNNETNVTYMECTYNDEPPIILTYNKYKKYGLVENVDENMVQQIRDEKICMESHDKPIRGISLYTQDELREIAEKIPSIVATTGWRMWKKPELYGKIWHALQWQ
jgi:hypothetical protein